MFFTIGSGSSTMTVNGLFDNRACTEAVEPVIAKSVAPAPAAVFNEPPDDKNSFAKSGWEHVASNNNLNPVSSANGPL
jgi:hypothetical protein